MRFSFTQSSISKYSHNIISSFSPNLNINVEKSRFSNILKSPISLSQLELNKQVISETKVVKSGTLSIISCQFLKCQGTRGGSVSAESVSTIIYSSNFESNNAETGGAISAFRCDRIDIDQSKFHLNTAKYTGALYLDSATEKNDAFVRSTNFTDNTAVQWTAAMRLDRNGGTLANLVFSNNSALACGAFFDFSYPPCVRNVNECLFVKNRAMSRGGAYCCFHVKQEVNFNKCTFISNMYEGKPNSISIDSVDIVVNLNSCSFTGSEANEIVIRFGGSTVNKRDTVFNQKDYKTIYN